jgi:hypothetical protein
MSCDGRADQGHADLEDDVDHELAAALRQEAERLRELEPLGHRDDRGAQDASGPQKEQVDSDRRRHLVDLVRMIPEITHLRLADVPRSRFQEEPEEGEVAFVVLADVHG